MIPRASTRAAPWTLLALSLALPGLASGLAAQAPGTPDPDTRLPLTLAVERLVDAPPLHRTLWGILAVDAATGEILVERNAHRNFVPASNAKILVTAAALLHLGPDHRFSTSLWAAGNLDVDGTLTGHLVVPGEGDPTLSARYWEDDEAPLRALVDSAVASGLRRVEGRLVVDVSTWDTVTTPSSWMVGNVPWGFSAVGGPFAIAEGTTRIALEGTDPGRPARVSWAPGGTPGFVESRVLTVAAGDTTARVKVTWMEEEMRHRVHGTLPAGEVDILHVSTRVPAREAGLRLLQLLDSAGIPVSGGLTVVADMGQSLPGGCVAGSVPACAGARPLAHLRSPPLLEIARGILEPSQNWMTEQVVRALAVAAGERGSWSTGLDEVERILMEEAEVDSLEVDLRDGSGLSAYNLVTPHALVAVLRTVERRPWGALYRDALASPGEEDSTLERRLLDLSGRVHAKTGTISNVNSLSGFLVTDAGREVVFAILTNGSGVPSEVVRERIDGLVRTLAAHD